MSKQINFETMTMDEYKNIKNFDITFGIVPTKFGQCLIGTHDDKICYMSLFDEGKDNSAIDILQQDWPNARLKEDTQKVEELANYIFNNNNNTKDEEEAVTKLEEEEPKKLNVLLRGTELQCKVWKELTNVKEGKTANYEQIAKAVGHPRAIRAVATAIAKNKIAYLVPCHRVIRKAGAPNKYRWGPQRKEKILKCEGSGEH